ncbi:MAG: lactonase family protein [Candidatus Tectimicrobiota bacterium]
MPYALYVGLQDEDKIVSFMMDAGSGQLTPHAEVPVAGGPFVLALSPDRRVLYVGQRVQPGLSSFRIDPSSGGLTLQGTVTATHGPTFLALDRSGRYLLSAYYQGGYAAVHPLGPDGAVGAPACDTLPTAMGAHAIQTDPSNQFAFVPHIARFNDNVLEPFRESTGPNMIVQLKFDAQSGRLTPNTPLQVEPTSRLGPRHYCFHPTLPVVYFSNEQGCSVTAYRLDQATGTLTALQTLTTLPEGFSARNTCSQIHLTASGQFLYVGNRGHNSLAGFAVDATSGQLTPTGHVATEAVPSAFALDPTGQFAFAAGTASGQLASYRINSETGKLTPLSTYRVGQRPAAVLVTPLGD